MSARGERISSSSSKMLCSSSATLSLRLIECVGVVVPSVAAKLGASGPSKNSEPVLGLPSGAVALIAATFQVVTCPSCAVS